MQDAEKVLEEGTVEETTEEVVDQDTGVTDDQESVEDTDPMAKLTEVLSQGAELSELEAKLAEQRELIVQQEQELRHRLASSLVDGLFVELAEFASMFTSGVIFERYQGIQAHIEKTKVHDPAFPKTLSQARYDVDSEHFQFWLGCLEKWICPGESLEKFLRGIFTGKTHGGPFQMD